MLAFLSSAALPWVIFLVAVLIFLALDLGVFHRSAHVVQFKEALAWTCVWFVVAMLFAFFFAPQLVPTWGKTQREEFITGYIIELSLSMDNVFVIALIFAYFRVPLQFQHRVLFWGILGALIMRGLMIWLGAALVEQFKWMFYVLGAFLIFTGIKMAFAGDEEVDPEKNPVIRIARRFFPVTPNFDGQKFMTMIDGRKHLTPLALALLMVETTDLIFAVDSIPAIFGITTDSYIVFTSNVFAILGLRSLYFVLAGAIGFFRYLKIGLALVLVFIGIKMFIAKWVHLDAKVSLAIVAAIICTAIGFSIFAGAKKKQG